MACTLTLAPVAFWKASMTCLGALTVFCAVHMVSFTPSSRPVGFTEDAGAALPEPASSELGSLQALASTAVATASASRNARLLG